ncbi:MAG: hypothetical protein AAF456_17250 [Planctomycetota bacterium]
MRTGFALFVFSLPAFVLLTADSSAEKELNSDSGYLTTHSNTDADAWVIESQAEWESQTLEQSGLEFREGTAAPTGSEATFKSTLVRFESARSADSITLKQVPDWLNWNPIENIGPSNLGDAPVMLRVGPQNYWMFGRYKGHRPRNGEGPFSAVAAELDGFDMPLTTTPFDNQYQAVGGQMRGLGGYHAWQSRDMVNWVHHGPVSDSDGKWMTSAEYVDGQAYLYYDFPNDQDPHVYVDADLFDGVPGENKGMAYADPTHGSDCAIIRDLDGNFNLILEDWTPINARTHAWDSPLAARAVSADGVTNFLVTDPPVDERTEATGETGTYRHPHWVKEAPDRFDTDIAEYEIHAPEQNAYGDWAAIGIEGRYYLFCDYDPAEEDQMSVGWFTSDSLDEQFRWCGNVGSGHPDPDIMFAEGQFYLATQQAEDFVSPGPWVESVEVRVGVDTDNDQSVDQWTDWSIVKESYDYVDGFSKQVSCEAASLDLSTLPAGFGFQFEFRLSDSTPNESKPVLDSVRIEFSGS